MSMQPRTAARLSGAAPDDFASLYRGHFHRLAAQLYAYLGDHAEAQDLTQEAFCRALQQWPKISRYDDPSAWVREKVFGDRPTGVCTRACLVDLAGM